MRDTFKKIFGGTNIPNPVEQIPLSRPSCIVPAECWTTTSNQRLLRVSLSAISHAAKVDLSDISEKMTESPRWPDIWPGEHYKLLAGLMMTLQPNLVVEIGTATGYSALAMKKFLPPQSKIVTFDIVSWKETRNCILTSSDFEDGRLRQEIADLSNREVFEGFREMLRNADFLFIDAAKDGVQEQIFIDHFKSVNFVTPPIFLFDDIRLMNMITIWQNLEKPKLDITSFGHWSGTGLVDWQ